MNTTQSTVLYVLAQHAGCCASSKRASHDTHIKVSPSAVDTDGKRQMGNVITMKCCCSGIPYTQITIGSQAPHATLPQIDASARHGLMTGVTAVPWTMTHMRHDTQPLLPKTEGPNAAELHYPQRLFGYLEKAVLFRPIRG